MLTQWVQVHPKPFFLLYMPYIQNMTWKCLSLSTKSDKYHHFYEWCSHGNNICAHKIIDECILRLNIANTMTTGSNKAIFIIIYAKFKEIDLKMCVCYYQIWEKCAFLCRVLTWKKSLCKNNNKWMHTKLKYCLHNEYRFILSQFYYYIWQFYGNRLENVCRLAPNMTKISIFM